MNIIITIDVPILMVTIIGFAVLIVIPAIRVIDTRGTNVSSIVSVIIITVMVSMIGIAVGLKFFFSLIKATALLPTVIAFVASTVLRLLTVLYLLVMLFLLLRLRCYYHY